MGGVGGGGGVFIRVTYIGSLSVDQRVAHTTEVGPMMMMQQSGRCDLAGLPQHNQTQHLPVAQAPSYSHNHHAHASAKQQIQHYNNDKKVSPLFFPFFLLETVCCSRRARCGE